MSNPDLISLVASIASLILAVVAIALSIVFYIMTNRLAEQASEASREIRANVNRLDSLFNSLYADTFSMMRDTVADMRKHMWPAAAAAAAATGRQDTPVDPRISDFILEELARRPTRSAPGAELWQIVGSYGWDSSLLFPALQLLRAESKVKYEGEFTPDPNSMITLV